jgi:hypothetical protein
MFEGGSHSVQLAHLAAHGLLASLPQAIPASHSHSPGSDWARKMTGIYGRKLGAYWLSCDPPDSWVRTLLGISIWGSTTCYLTWKKSVTPQGRLLFRLVPSTRHTAGIGSGSLLATPRAIYGEHPGMEDMSHLTGQAIERERLWPTPDTPSGGRTMPEGTTPTGMTPDGRKVTVGLENAVKEPGMKLNSAWVQRMMGYPDDWLTLDGEAIR